MNSKQLLKSKLAGQPTDRTLFCPAIYEHKAALLGKSPSEVSQSAELTAESVFAEYETYKPDALVVGIDIYNIEAQALGCGVRVPDGIESVPVVDQRILSDISQLDKLVMCDPQSSARMPLVLDAAKAVNNKLGEEVYVRGAISGPYSIAAELLGVENAIMAMVMQPDEFAKLMQFTTEVAINYGLAFVARGVEVCVFDSQAAPPLISPDLFEQMVLPYTQKLNGALKAAGAEFIEYVIGGQTEPVAESLCKMDADILLSDFVCDPEALMSLSPNAVVRRNVSPITIENGDKDEIASQVKDAVELSKKYNNVIVGTGVISYNAKPENLLYAKQLCFDMR